MTIPMTPDYGEPWRYDVYPDDWTNVDILVDRDGCRIGNDTWGSGKERIERAASCVNACAGIATPEKVVPLILQILEFFAKEDIRDMLYWRTDGEYAPITFWVNTNDILYWGCADLEEVNAETFPILKQTVADCVVIDPVLGATEGCSLFSCRVRKMRPQGAAYPDERKLWPLFDACGPEREVGLGNPYRPGRCRES